ncbi:hypothetical protein KQI88_05065 [Alkaliphilus sp. MSJ-5]|uniref:Transmembrane protein n=1 Tax=Alkaliphilus flagellatus TaxID=2841507 RepID=A0ABS6G0C3_9FIRM|nr:hypothetical protein [Alkaliphilus flagellatus]MBU5675779.1 hypothetical protein [Alkaliphilus flagellatus]
MRYEVKLDGFEDKKIEVEVKSIRGPRLLINGKAIPKDRKNKMILCRDDGVEVIATWKSNFLSVDAVPKLVVDDKEIQVAEPLKWYVKVWCSLPLLLLLWGGALGAMCGFIAISINSKIFRSSMNQFLKFLTTIIISLLAAVVYFIIGSLAYLALEPNI